MHKAESLIDRIVNDGQIELVVFSDALPVRHAGAAKRIDADFQACFFNRVHIHYLRQSFNVRLDQIFFLDMTAGPRLIERQTLHLFQVALNQLVGAIFHHFGDIGVGRAAVRRIIFDAAIFRRVVGRRNHNAVSLRAARFIVLKNRVGDRRRRRIAVILLHNHINAVGRQHFKHGDNGGL